MIVLFDSGITDPQCVLSSVGVFVLNVINSVLSSLSSSALLLIRVHPCTYVNNTMLCKLTAEGHTDDVPSCVLGPALR